MFTIANTAKTRHVSVTSQSAMGLISKEITIELYREGDSVGYITLSPSGAKGLAEILKVVANA